ncbi:hypothetical protein BC937DRAFT_94857 [Endogone sp. FLAS-F59071]|nr:hypothetical protein BC937DRAFT_94857 [Endogone sp. FLAS-F59071]|eukprot:RUS22928.1 hypothetical protein BC937DRAFT_94857 [Endogone sp. FLAS-F59071]
MLTSLPPELLLHLTAHLPLPALWHLSNVSRFLRALCLQTLRHIHHIDLESERAHTPHIVHIRSVFVYLTDVDPADDHPTDIAAIECLARHVWHCGIVEQPATAGEPGDRTALDRLLELVFQHAVAASGPKKPSPHLLLFLFFHEHANTPPVTFPRYDLAFPSSTCRAALSYMQSHPPFLALTLPPPRTSAQRSLLRCSLADFSACFSLIAELYAGDVIGSDYLFILAAYGVALMAAQGRSDTEYEGENINGVELAARHAHDKLLLATRFSVLRNLLGVVNRCLRRHARDGQTSMIRLVRYLREETERVNRAWLAVIKKAGF